MIGALLLFSALNFSDLTPNVDVSKIIDKAGASAPMDIAADSEFLQTTGNFSPGQTVYIRITTENDGSDKHNLNVHDGDYNILSTYQLSRSGNVFAVNFPAPQTAGTYSLEADIRSNGSVLNLVKTITVGSGENSSAKVKVENKINPDNQILGEASGSSIPSPAAEAPEHPKIQKPNIFFSVWLKFIGFLRNIF